MNILVLAMGGSGTRLGSSIPKQYIEINNIPIFGYILEKYNRMDFIDKIVIISNEQWIDYVEKHVETLKASKVYAVVAGGDNRNSSIKNGFKVIKKFAKDEDVILFHDATHPYVDEEGTKQVIEAIKEYGAATLASYNYDTVYNKNEENTITEVVPRNNIIAGASPEGFQFKYIYPIYANASEEELEKMTSAGAIALAHNIKIKVVECSYLNLKITYKRDLEIFKKLVNTYFFEDFDSKNIDRGGKNKNEQ